MITDNTLMKRRLALIKDEPIFRQQSGGLQKMGDTWASQEANITIKSALRNIDLIVWDESENLLRNFAQDLDFAPHFTQAFLTQIADKGRDVNLEFQLPSMVAAFTVVRICAGGKEVRKKHNGLLKAIINSQKQPTYRYDYFNQWCVFFDQNKYDPATGEETIYRRGDPMDRAKDTEDAKAEARIEELLGQILEATRGWNTKDAFEDYWEQWTELWVYLLKQEEMTEKVSQKHPGSRANNTSINITLVCNVAGLMKRHLEKSLKQASLPDTSFADLIEEAWKADTRRKEVSKITEIEEQANQINGWLAMNVK